ncbi:hypothetical protein AKJ54_00645 [candidate division MSBL1 archaeon SCGC-AAA382K21]|uniref:Uncharacterized protein n=1 Tax=candidate division MSBL1 archaeon SCGC-AAA382K21 TaxID=1698283 RepID=A0A133VL14_9EURY|nr:hypothetical protein AKJ54_00645 [candidate division MSBL1 archaeon SCGC-AAA382K21]
MFEFVPMQELLAGNIGQSLLYVMNNYFIYGSMWFLLGMAIFMIVQAKIRDYNISGIVMGLYFLVFSPYMYALAPYIIYIQGIFAVIIAVSLYNLLVRE